MTLEQTATVGLFGIGLDTYWDQFEGLLDNLNAYQQQIKFRLKELGVNVVDVNMLNV